MLGPLFAGMSLQLLLAGLAFGNFFRYLSSRNYATDPRAHRALLWVVMIQLGLITGLHAAQCFYHGVSQKRTIDGLYSVAVIDAAAPVMDGVVGALVQGFLMVRASRVGTRLWTVHGQSQKERG